MLTQNAIIKTLIDAAHLSAVGAFLLCNSLCAAQEDPIYDKLDAAKASYRQQADNAREFFVDAIDGEINRIRNETRLAPEAQVALLNQLKSERDQFLKDSTRIPSRRRLRSAARRFQKAIRLAKAEVIEAFDAAADAYRQPPLYNFKSAEKVINEKAAFFLPTPGKDKLPTSRLFGPNAKAAWSLQGTELALSGGKPKWPQRFFFGDPEWKDYDFSVDVRIDEIAESTGFIACAVKDNKDFWVFNLCPWGDEQLVELTSQLGGKWGPEDNRAIEEVAEDIRPGTWYSLLAKIRGTTIEVFVDGQPVAKRTANSLSHGRCGLHGWGPVSSRFRNLRVVSVDGTVLWQDVPVPELAEVGP